MSIVLKTLAASNFNDIDNGNTSLPIVDLGYINQRATVFNETGQYYNFSSIRYGRSPEGDLRFRGPQAPINEHPLVRNGEIGRICPQADGDWVQIARQFLPRYLQGQTAFDHSGYNTTSGGDIIPTQDPRVTEDCLFLDVHVPKEIFEKRGEKSNRGAAMLVWIHGGGYTYGSKQSSGIPAGLIARARRNHSSGIIFVAINYRLGAFGWSSGPTFQEHGTANAGLYDQRLALQWIQQHIAKFGGNPNCVTVMGESAEGGSIMHQLTAYGNSTPAPFQQAVIQSPGFVPLISSTQQETTFRDFLRILNVSSIDQAREMPYETLQAANQNQVGHSPYGQYTFGPGLDGTFIPQHQSQMLAKGLHARYVKLMVAYNADEGLVFVPPYIQNDTAFQDYVANLVPTMNMFPGALEYLSGSLYPRQTWPNQIARTSQLAGDAVINCNTFYLNEAYNNQTYAYLFAVPPALHGDDIDYTFYNDGGPTQTVTSPGIAIALQKYITNFPKYGNPAEHGLPPFPVYGMNASIQVLNATGIAGAVDHVARERCIWWQKALHI